MNFTQFAQTLPLGLTFDDVSLCPAYSDVLPMDADLSTRLSDRLKLDIPVLSAAMDTVTDGRMAEAIARLGGLGVIHKNMSPQTQAELIRNQSQLGLKGAAPVGPIKDAKKRAELLLDAGIETIVVDTAHGDSQGVLEAVAYVRALSDAVTIVGGNIVSGEAALRLYDAGADAVKVGVGPGSICTTRVIAGVGVPQLSAILNVAAARGERGFRIIADGGIRFSGDAVKAIAAGADAIMMGSMFAATEEAPGEVIEEDGIRYKRYRGMGSLGAMVQGSKDRYGQGDVQEKQKLVPEGISGRVRIRGTLSDVLGQLVGGIRSGMGYLGASSIPDMKRRAEFIRVTNAGLRESHPHDVLGIEHAPNYEANATRR